MLLAEIIRHKTEEVAKSKAAVPLSQLKAQLENVPAARPFRRAITGKRPLALIAEIKYRSPSGGVLRADFSPLEIARNYEAGGAAAISVLTDRRYFGGSPFLLQEIKTVTTVPILRKEFIIDSYQIYEARSIGTDAVLLIAAILNDQELLSFVALTDQLGMDALLEVHNRAELARVLRFEKVLIGINNRDLDTLETDINISLDLIRDPRLKHRVVVAESGISGRNEVQSLTAAGISAILVGATLLQSPDIPAKIKELLGG